MKEIEQNRKEKKIKINVLKHRKTLSLKNPLKSVVKCVETILSVLNICKCCICILKIKKISF